MVTTTAAIARLLEDVSRQLKDRWEGWVTIASSGTDSQRADHGIHFF
jgi:hypothetical protein